jgi:hypothetical protein
VSAELERADYLPEVPPFFERDGHRYELKGDRIVRDGTEVAVLVSGGFGAGFSTWNKISPMNPLAVTAILFDRRDLLANASEDERARMGDRDAYMGGVDDVSIHWVPVGTLFRVDEYDGAESVEYLSDAGFTQA